MAVAMNYESNMKRNKNPLDSVTQYADYTELRKPLPPPPAGFRWERDDSSGEWTLIPPETDASKMNCEVEECGNIGPMKSNSSEVPVEPPEFIEHVIMPEDTLVGLCLRYKTNKDVLRRHNDFFGEQFRLCHTLRIPTKNKNMASINLQTATKEVKIQITMNKTGLTDVEAQLYLDEHDWDVETAVSHAKDDLRWEAEQAYGMSMQQDQIPTTIANPIVIGVPISLGSENSDDIELSQSSSRDWKLDQNIVRCL